MNEKKKEETKKEVKKSKNHPHGYDFTKVAAPDTLRVSRNGKDKKPAAQLVQLIRFIKDNKIGKISRKDYYDKVNVINTEEDKNKRDRYKEQYPALEKSVQTIAAVSNFYWVRGDIKQVGVVAVEA